MVSEVPVGRILVVVVVAPLNGERSLADRAQFVENFLEVLAHLFERKEDGLEFPLFQHVHEILNLFVAPGIKFTS